MRKCRKGWHLYDGRGWGGICSRCILNTNHPTLRRKSELLHTTEGRQLVRGLLPDLHAKVRSLPVRSRQRLAADYKQAASLLKDDLVWSGDFDSIRMDLYDLIEFYAKAEYYPSALTNIVDKLLADENDLSVR